MGEKKQLIKGVGSGGNSKQYETKSDKQYKTKSGKQLLDLDYLSLKHTRLAQSL